MQEFMTAFDEGLALVLAQLTAGKRLLQPTLSVTPEILRNLVAGQKTKVTQAEVIPSRSEPQVLSKRESAPISFLTTGDKTARMAALREIVLPCTKCAHLAASRTQVVFGVGNLEADLMFVGEAPGEEEDLQGEPFVGKAGELLTKMIGAMGLRREDLFIGNVLKCRPDMPTGESGNRKPVASEMATCLPYLQEQIDIVRPKVIVALGLTALDGLTGDKRPMKEARGHWMDFQGTPFMVTYHPAYLLRNQAVSEKRKVWEDLLLVMERLKLPISEKQRNYFTR